MPQLLLQQSMHSVHQHHFQLSESETISPYTQAISQNKTEMSWIEQKFIVFKHSARNWTGRFTTSTTTHQFKCDQFKCDNSTVTNSNVDQFKCEQLKCWPIQMSLIQMWANPNAIKFKSRQINMQEFESHTDSLQMQTSLTYANNDKTTTQIRLNSVGATTVCSTPQHVEYRWFWLLLQRKLQRSCS